MKTIAGHLSMKNTTNQLAMSSLLLSLAALAGCSLDAAKPLRTPVPEA
jgi:hypothetical protein